MDFKTYLKKFEKRINLVNSLFDKKELIVSYDKLISEKKVDHEILYFKFEDKEEIGLFLFGFEYFLKELGEQEFKKVLGQNSLNFRIYKAYSTLKKKQRKIKVSDILNFIQNEKKDSLDLHKILRRVLTMAYYFNWELEKDKKDLEGDSIIKIPNQFLTKVTQRFNFDIVAAIYENEDLFIFLNARGKVNLIFKDLDFFNKKDVENLVFKALKKVYSIKKITINEN